MVAFFSTLKKLTLGLLLIAGAAAVLLYSDLGSRHRAPAGGADAHRGARVAIVQYASQEVIDSGFKGTLAGLREHGYAEGERLTLRSYNAQGDLPTANAIAKEVVNAGYDLVITLTTVSMQTVANANRFGSTHSRHVFGLVTDPYGSGVGISRENHAEHPPYMTGYGSLQPVAETFELARRMRPELKTVGLVWNPTESNSVAQTTIARAACAKLGITLVEANAENSTSVAEASASLLSRGVEAIWVSGDVTVLVAADAIIAAAKRARIPVFSSIPPTTNKGALFDLGADYDAIGRAVGQLAASVLDGRDPATIPVENLVPRMLLINRSALEGLRDRWEIPAALLEQASVVIDAEGRHVKNVTAAPAVSDTVSDTRAKTASLTHKMQVDLIEYVDTPNGELAREGLLAGFTQAGLVPDRDFVLRRRNAQGDIATLSSSIDAAITDRTDLILASATPSLQGALRRGKNTPIVFTLIANPFLAGAGKTDTDHLPLVTGSYLPAPFAEALAEIKRCLPNARRIGTLFTPSEINSVFYKEQLEILAKAAGYELEVVGVSSSSEVPDAALALGSRRIDAFTQISDNLTGSAYTGIVEAAKRYRLPLVAFAAGVADRGPFLTVSRDYFDNGVQSALIAARVLRGESTAKIPFVPVAKITYTVNMRAAGALGIKIPPDLLAKADKVIR